jgi:hypothetical protein
MKLEKALAKYNCNPTPNDIINIVFDFENGLTKKPIGRKYLPNLADKHEGEVGARIIGKIVDEYAYHNSNSQTPDRRNYWKENRLLDYITSLSERLGKDISVNYNAKSYVESIEEDNAKQKYDQNDPFYKHYTKTNRMNYNAQKSMAGKRGISWEFNSFEGWITWWLQTGKFDKRGVTNDAYQMCRYGDTGPYSPDNVYCATGKQNKADYWSSEVNKIAHGKKVGKGHEKPLQTPLGSFKSRKEAANAHNVTFNCIIYRMKKQPTEYYDI